MVGFVATATVRVTVKKSVLYWNLIGISSPRVSVVSDKYALMSALLTLFLIWTVSYHDCFCVGVLDGVSEMNFDWYGNFGMILSGFCCYLTGF